MKPSTFSIVAADPESGECGVAVASKFLAVGSAVPWARGGVGAIATQAFANTSYGPKGLDLLERGLSPSEVIKRLTAEDPGREDRQLGVVDMRGGPGATFTGSKCFSWAGGIARKGMAAQGNILVSEATVKAMASTFEAAKAPLPQRLVSALAAGDAAGGDSRGKQSAAILVVRPKGGYAGFNDRYLDLRVDDHPDPVKELHRLFELWRLYFEPASEDELVPIQGALARELSSGLKRLGYDPGPAGDTWDEPAQAAFTAYSERENLEDRLRKDGKTDRRVLEYFRKQVTPS